MLSILRSLLLFCLFHQAFWIILAAMISFSSSFVTRLGFLPSLGKFKGGIRAFLEVKLVFALLPVRLFADILDRVISSLDSD